MANKLKKSSKKPGKTNSENLKTEKEEKVSFKELARDERTWKIIGAVSLAISILLFIAFISYFFTWKEDQDKVQRGGLSILMDDNIIVSNLLGRLGAVVSHFFIYKGFGIASLLICTFFFIVGVNLLFRKKFWSVWRNVRYVTVGMVVLSVCLAFVFAAADFSFGGAVGKMIVRWLERFLGSFGTGALLFVVALGYIIWQFNPNFKVPEKKKEKEKEIETENEIKKETPSQSQS